MSEKDVSQVPEETVPGENPETKTGNKRKYIKRAALAVLAALLLCFLVWFVPFAVKNAHYLSVPNVTKEQLDALSLDGVNKLMIVAHPDDEFIWGGAHLLADDWLVVVITNGDNKTRHPEFETMMAATPHTSPTRMTRPRAAPSIVATSTGPGVGGMNACPTARPASSGMA